MDINSNNKDMMSEKSEVQKSTIEQQNIQIANLSNQFSYLIKFTGILVTINVFTVGLFSYRLHEAKREVDSIKNSFDTYVSTKLDEAIQIKQTERAKKILYSFFNDDSYLKDKYGKEFSGIIRSQNIDMFALDMIRTEFEKYGLKAKNIKKDVPHNRERYLRLMIFLSMFKSNDISNAYFERFLNMDGFEIKDSGDDWNEDAIAHVILKYYAQDSDRYMNQILKIAKLVEQGVFGGNSLEALEGRVNDKRILSAIYDCIKKEEHFMERFQYDKALIDYIYSSDKNNLKRIYENIKKDYEISMNSYFYKTLDS